MFFRKTYLKSNKQNSGLRLYLTLLTALFILLQVAYLIKFSGFYLADIELVADHLSVPLKIIPPLVLLFLIQLFLHVLFIFLIGWIAEGCGAILNLSVHHIENLGMSLWGCGLVTIIFSNQYFYPNSKFSGFSQLFANHSGAGFLAIIAMGILIISALIALIGMIQTRKLSSLFFSLAILFLVLGVHQHKKMEAFAAKDAATQEKPNVIIIGIDSLRPDFLGFFGYEKITPFLDDFLNHATVFSDALTPLARTFPAWVSILTGKYPLKNGARTNLTNPQKLQLATTLSALLRQQGYATIFASDETRFSNIDSRFGFDKILTPPIGFNDFLIGAMNDFPLSNLLVNTVLGKWLFPYNYANRPSLATYDPNSFLQMLKPALLHPRNKPLFLAIHFCLPHFPYYWGGYALQHKSLGNYQASIHRVDAQVKDFMAMLEKAQLLKHTIVILLSDHGETLELAGDRATDPTLFISGLSNPKHIIPPFYPPSLDTEKVDAAAGHGTDVLAMPQYHTLLAMRMYGMQKNVSRVIPGWVSLLDIKPTVLDFLNLHTDHETGKSLKKVVLDHHQRIPNSNADFFIESDFSPQSIRTVHPETRDVLFSGINYFQIDPVTTRITVKPGMEKLIISSKQYAVIRKEWILALYPQKNGLRIPILVNLQNGEWTNDLSTSFAEHSPAKEMLASLKAFHSGEL